MHTPGRVNPFVNREALKSVDREVFLGRVRKGLGHDVNGPSPLPVGAPERDEKLIRQVAKEDAGRVNRWVQKATASGMVVTRVGVDAEAITGAIAAAFAKHDVKKVIVNASDVGERFGVSGYLKGKGLEEMRWGTAGSMDLAFHCDASITDVRAGLADTGAMLVWSEVGFGRSSTLVVPVHVVLLPESRILADMMDGFDLVMQVNGGKMPSNVVVINGPSKTSDIEMRLVTGVHGPKFLYVVVIEGM